MPYHLVLLRFALICYPSGILLSCQLRSTRLLPIKVLFVIVLPYFTAIWICTIGRIALMIVVDTCGEVNPKETKVQLTTTAGALDM